MNHNMLLTRITLWLNRVIFLLVAALLPALPFVLDWYSTFRVLSREEYMAIMIGFYICAVISFVALWTMDKLLRNILKQQVFVRANVRLIRVIQWCCAAVCLVCLPAAVVYMPLIFLVVIMGFLALVVCVVAQIMKAAVAIREENDLTI